MRRFGKYIVTAFITFALGLMSSFVTGGHWFSSSFRCPASPALQNRTRHIVSSVAGEGVTSGGFAHSFSEQQYSDGTYLNEYATFYSSADRAKAELLTQLQQASEILLQGKAFDEKERETGVKVVAVFGAQNGAAVASPELLWTEDGALFVKKSNSLKVILEESDKMR